MIVIKTIIRLIEVKKNKKEIQNYEKKEKKHRKKFSKKPETKLLSTIFWIFSDLKKTENIIGRRIIVTDFSSPEIPKTICNIPCYDRNAKSKVHMRRTPI